MTGFDRSALLVRTSDGWNVTVVESFTFTRRDGEVITVLAGAESDGVSSPVSTWSLYPPSGVYWLAAVLHDAIYRMATSPIFTSRDEADRVFLEALEWLGVPKLTRQALYQTVVRFGESAWNESHSKGARP